MKYTKAQIEDNLRELLIDCLSSANQDSSLISLELDEGGETCTIKMNVTIVEEDNYIGFDSY